jgi:hypothetical protein
MSTGDIIYLSAITAILFAVAVYSWRYFQQLPPPPIGSMAKKLL